MKEYFVMIRDQHGSAMIMMADEDEVAFFETFEEADEAGAENLMAKACGHEVFRLGSGCEY